MGRLRKSSLLIGIMRIRRRRRESDRRARFFRYFMRRQQELTNLILTLVLLYPQSSRLPRSVWVLPRSMHFWESIVMTSWDDDLWLENFRMTKDTFKYLVDELRPSIARQDTQFRRCISVEHRLAITLWRLATNADNRTLGSLFGVAKCTVCVIFLDTIRAIDTVLRRKHINIPTGQRLQKCLQRFTGKGFPQAVGAIDGSHIPIIAPHKNHRDFCNRKGYYSVILQGTVDSFGQFIDAVVGWPGSVHDARVFSNSKIYEQLENSTLFPNNTKNINGTSIPIMLLGDPAYPLMKNLMKPYSDNGRLSREEFEFNKRLSSCRVTVEHVFGRLKSRWRILSKTMDIYLENVPTVVMACCILHNIVESHGNPFYDHWLLEGELVQTQVPAGPPMPNSNSNGGGTDVRRALTHFFSN